MKHGMICYLYKLRSKSTHIRHRVESYLYKNGVMVYLNKIKIKNTYIKHRVKFYLYKIESKITF